MAAGLSATLAAQNAAPPTGPGNAGRGRGDGSGPTRGANGAPGFGTEENAPLIFEERWTNAPLTQPLKQENLGNQHLKLHLYGDVVGIRKTQHPLEDYTYTGEAPNTWMITVSDPQNYFDLRLPGKVMLRTRNTGYRQTHIAIRTADGRYYVTEEGSGESSAWMNRDYILSDMHWRSLKMEDTPTNLARKPDPERAVIVAAGVATPDLSKSTKSVLRTCCLAGSFRPRHASTRGRCTARRCNAEARMMTKITVAAVLLLVGHVTVASAQVPAAATVAAGVVNQDVYPEHNVSFPGGVTGIPDLVFYSPSSYRAVRMDLYLPPASFSGPRPFVVYTHGGGWSGGSKRTTGAFSNWPGVLAALAAKGYVVASLDYRLLGDEIAPAAIQDTKAAVKFLRANAATYNIDKNRSLTWGPSAGGQLAALAATSCGVTALSPPPRAPRGAGAGGRRGQGPGRAATVETAAAAPTGMDAESDCVQAAIGWYGVYDFRPLNGGGGAYLGCAAASPCDPEKLKAQSPIVYVSEKTPPMLIVHGEKDTTVPVAQARDLHAMLKAKGVKAELMLLPDVGHSFIGETPEATRAASLKALERSFRFIDETIGR
jgi:acetyl esterase/lipase